MRDAAIVFDGERVAAVTRAGGGAGADRCIDASGRCVIPGFVDSHTHLVFAGERGDEFAARMAGAPYAAGGIRETVAATRAASREQLRALTHARRQEALRAGITHVEIKSGYGLDAEHERRCCEIAAEFTDDVTFLGAHVVPDGVGRRRLRRARHAARCSTRARRTRAGSTCSASSGAFDADQSRAVLEAGRAAGLIPRIHANQLGHGPGVQLGVELGAASADHCTYLSDDDIDALAGSDTVATFLPATDFSTRQPYPDARRAIDAGVRVAIATNCNPGSSYTTSMAFCIALAVRDMRMTVEEALTAATLGGARALRRSDIGHLGVGARADAVLLDAPSYAHLVYRPGMPLVALTFARGAPAG